MTIPKHEADQLRRANEAMTHMTDQPKAATDAPQRFISLPVEITAKQWDGTRRGWWDLCDWAGSEILAEGIVGDGPPKNLSVPTREGRTRLVKGAWLIRGIEGEWYPCADSVFRAKYAAALPPSPDAARLAQFEALAKVSEEIIEAWDSDIDGSAQRAPDVIENLRAYAALAKVE